MENKRKANEIAAKIMADGHREKEGIQQRRDIVNAILEMAAIKDKRIKELEQQLSFANMERDRLETNLTILK